MSGTDTGPEWISEMPCPIGTSSPSKLHAPKSNFLWGSVSTFRCAGSLFERELAGESLHQGPNPLLVMLQTKPVMLLVAILTRIRMITSYIYINICLLSLFSHNLSFLQEWLMFVIPKSPGPRPILPDSLITSYFRYWYLHISIFRLFYVRSCQIYWLSIFALILMF